MDTRLGSLRVLHFTVLVKESKGSVGPFRCSKFPVINLQNSRSSSGILELPWCSVASRCAGNSCSYSDDGVFWSQRQFFQEMIAELLSLTALL